MHIKFLFFTHAIFVFAHNVSRSNHHHRHLYSAEQQISYDKNHLKPVIMRGNNKQSQLQEFKKNRSIIDKHMKKKNEETTIPWNLSKETDRLEFHIQGHDGPQTYIFGFDTGYGKNRQYRLEERHRNGTIKGQYGYYDAKGKLRTVRYIATPFEGYKEIHHESNIQKLTN